MKDIGLLFGILLSAVVFSLTAQAASGVPAVAGPNMVHIYLTLGILLVAALLFFTEAIPLAVTAVLVPCALSTFGVISVKDAWISFGDTSILTIVGLFMLGEATFATGFAQRSAAWVIRKAGTSQHSIIIVSIAMIGIMSAFLNNAGVTAITLPMLISIARRAHLSPSRILLPTAYAASVGGCISLVGTAPNMVANSLIAKMAPGTRVFGFFEFGYYGVPLLIITIIMYTVFSKWLLPGDRPDTALHVEEEDVPFTKYTVIAGAIFFMVIISMATGLIPLTSAAMLGAMLCIITRCISVENAFKGVDWTTIYLFAGMLSMSFAMEKSGAALLLANTITQYVSDPYAILAIACIITGLITNVMSNTATTAIMVPLIIPLTLNLGYSPLPFVMGVCASASACFLTPIATPSNTLVLRPGNYTFFDYVKYGWALQVVALVLCMVLVPYIWPFQL
ncbi:SLC13 family permease [Desulfovibrio cuneatus]|uniref:SLC13 family permease n=1 Tax=Desulfovibrio cuneatus TaxID=159728 RepID=UPI0003F4DFDD|nr:SLC13 family permease [Desulfovibrio cuneatus]